MSEKIELLLLEDNAADSRMFIELMKEVPSNPIEVTLVTSLGSAITRLLQKPKIDLIVCDLNISDSSGLDTVVTLTKVSDIPIIVLTGSDQHGTVFKAMDYGAYDYFIKGELNSRWIFHVLLRAFHEKGTKAQGKEVMNQQRYLIDQASEDLQRAISNLNKIQKTLTKIEKELNLPIKDLQGTKDPAQGASLTMDSQKVSIASSA